MRQKCMVALGLAEGYNLWADGLTGLKHEFEFTQDAARPR